VLTLVELPTHLKQRSANLAVYYAADRIVDDLGYRLSTLVMSLVELRDLTQRGVDIARPEPGDRMRRERSHSSNEVRAKHCSIS
jgi:hypothetical protein